ncbi:MAG: hypothetical protein IPJ39_22280 [Saprospiraceae bacterium]|nr:hypothetical protein [Saprospiraceae bacterium]
MSMDYDAISHFTCTFANSKKSYVKQKGRADFAQFNETYNSQKSRNTEWANGTKVCEINLGSQDITKIEIVHKAGRSVEDHHLASRATSSLMKDGLW